MYLYWRGFEPSDQGESTTKSPSLVSKELGLMSF
jgi:hypothetical protein